MQLEIDWFIYIFVLFVYSMRRHPRTVLRPDEIIRGWRSAFDDKIPLPRRLRRQGLLQYRGEFHGSPTEKRITYFPKNVLRENPLISRLNEISFSC